MIERGKAHARGRRLCFAVHHCPADGGVHAVERDVVVQRHSFHGGQCATDDVLVPRVVDEPELARGIGRSKRTAHVPHREERVVASGADESGFRHFTRDIAPRRACGSVHERGLCCLANGHRRKRSGLRNHQRPLSAAGRCRRGNIAVVHLNRLCGARLWRRFARHSRIAAVLRRCENHAEPDEDRTASNEPTVRHETGADEVGVMGQVPQQHEANDAPPLLDSASSMPYASGR